jgi:hypothetical protein
MGEKVEMTLMLKDFADIKLVADDPEERFISSGVSWEQYEALLTKLGDSPWYRVTYLEECWRHSLFCYFVEGKIKEQPMLPVLVNVAEC